MDPASPLLNDVVAGETMPAELLAAFVEVMLESSEHRAPTTDSRAAAS